MKTKKTLRKLPPLTRAIAKNLNTIELAISRIDRLMPHLERAEHDSKALWVNTENKITCAQPENSQEGEGLF